MLLKYSPSHKSYNDKYVILIYVNSPNKCCSIKISNYKIKAINPSQNKITAWKIWFHIQFQKHLCKTKDITKIV